MKRIPVGLAALAVLAAGATTSACNTAPFAASVNGTTISVASLNVQLANLTTTRPGQCLLSLNAGQALDLSGVGTGGLGTYQLSLAAAVLSLGARSVVAAVSPVPDDVAAAAMTAHHEALASGAPSDEALAQAISVTDPVAAAFLNLGGRFTP